MKLIALLSLLSLSTLVYAGRGRPEQTPKRPGLHKIIKKNGKIFIVDRKGEQWDVTSAANEFGMEPKLFHFGLGRGAFTPIIDPEIEAGPKPGDPLVFAVTYNGIARAYNHRRLTRHETLLDNLGGTRVMVAHCYLADLAGVYEATVDGRPLTLIASGWTYHNGHHDTFVLYDKETGSLWFPFDKDDFFVSIGGPLKGKKLMELASMKKVKFSKWKKKHPDTGYVR